jgi:hypothetical protein
LRLVAHHHDHHLRAVEGHDTGTAAIHDDDHDKSANATQLIALISHRESSTP